MYLNCIDNVVILQLQNISFKHKIRESCKLDNLENLQINPTCVLSLSKYVI